MNILKPSRRMAQRLLLAGLALSLAGCASAPWDDWFSDSAAAQPAVFAKATPVTAGYYRVNRGDTLASVAAAFGREPAQIARWNRLSDDAVLSGGQVLRVAPYPDEAPGPAAASVPQAAADSATRQTRFQWPAPGPVTTRFEERQSRSIHIGGNAGETIRAAGDGRVIYAGSQIKAYGLLVIIKHDRRFVTAYGNNAKVLVNEGDVVKQGQPIAEMGAASDPNPYLIFELRDNTKAVDPQGYLPKRPG